ncbi:hypothetical protein DL766_003478 [Monosporascus sp. MC13-8B]|uniref:Major facilitator superfamily (MFS) profile domain-containing protein n=1 Tax=Monosporascus cannonballus TaxID=155416 RepID=A0ABY0HFM0_9PEZI|nr:hypothetical protein DL763_008400 [Monosporascus cannonballus]RYO91521.1 hypothetical protein DL762_002135 [Monosporascus cannonballus]RYP33415.1 hypothetical protein DL766_003478 [Monosporascus sp. MC13-8B]
MFSNLPATSRQLLRPAPFRQKFGLPLDNGDRQLTARLQSGLQNGIQVGQILGLMVAGILADRYGYKKMRICMLFVGGILCGLRWGAFQTLTTTYAADVAPLGLRPILTTYAFPPPIILGVLFMPESPTWLVRHGRLADAKNSLCRLTSSLTEEIDYKVAMIAHTNELEREAQEGTSYLDCFRGVNRRRTGIACGAWIAQVCCGTWFGGNGDYFLQQAGFDAEIKTVVLARNAYNISSIIANFLNPPVLNPTAWNLRGRGGLIRCGFCLCVLVWAYSRLPEPKGLSPAELDMLFEQRVSAHKFRKVHVDPFQQQMVEESYLNSGSLNSSAWKSATMA